MAWNYRIVRFRNDERVKAMSGEAYYYALHEVYYDAQDKPISLGEKPAGFVAGEEEGGDGIVSALQMALNGARNRPVLDESDIGKAEIGAEHG